MVAVATGRGLNSACESPFEVLPCEDAYAFIFGEQEINHLTRDELFDLLQRCLASLNPGGRLLLNAANCANPLISTEYPGNNWDHYLQAAEGNMTQAFSRAGFREVTPFALDFYVWWGNPLNYVAKALTATLHFVFKMMFRVYGKNATILTKRLGITAVR